MLNHKTWTARNFSFTAFQIVATDTATATVKIVEVPTALDVTTEPLATQRLFLPLVNR